MNWEEVIINIVGNAVNGIIVGIFTVIGVGITIKHNQRKEERQEKSKYRNKSELIVENYKTESEKNFDMQLLVAGFEIENKTDFKYSNGKCLVQYKR